MFRLTLIPFVLLFGTLLFGIVSFFIIRKIRRIYKATLEKGSELANKQQKNWAKREKRKKLPDILQKGFDQYDKLVVSYDSLPLEWKTALSPLVIESKLILDEVAEGAEQGDSHNNKKLNSIRSFFNHTLDALLQFSEKLNSNHAQMNAQQIEKARQNITVFKADLLNHQETLLKAKHMDFDVMMDVIKARLKK